MNLKKTKKPILIDAFTAFQKASNSENVQFNNIMINVENLSSNGVYNSLEYELTINNIARLLNLGYKVSECGFRTHEVLWNEPIK